MIQKSMRLILWIFGFQLAIYIIDQFLHLHLTSWYQQIEKSPLNPPEIVFPVVWSAMYAMISVAGFLLSQERGQPEIKTALIYYWIQVILIWSWAPIVFALHWTGVGFFWTLGIFAATLMAIITAAEKCEFAATLLAPSLLWTLYVAYLCGYLWLNN